MGILALYVLLDQIGWPRSKITAWLREGAAAKDKLQSSMTEVLKQERGRIESGETGARNFLSAILRYSGQGAGEEGGGGARMPGKILLSDEEVYGNLFVYLMGGFTTEKALAFAVMRMAIDPHLQEWVTEEIDPGHAITGEDQASTPSCEVPFPRLTRAQYSKWLVDFKRWLILALKYPPPLLRLMLTRLQIQSQQKAQEKAHKGGKSTLKMDKGMKFQCVRKHPLAFSCQQSSLCWV